MQLWHFLALSVLMMKWGNAIRHVVSRLQGKMSMDAPKMTRFNAPGRAIMTRMRTANFCSTVDDSHQPDTRGQEFPSSSKLNLNGLRKEANRQYLRTVKKVGKASERVNKAKAEYDAFMALENPSLADLDKCPNPEEVEAELAGLKGRLSKLQKLETRLAAIRSDNDDDYGGTIAMALELGVSDVPPPPQRKGPGKKGKKKGFEPGPRMPYFVYQSCDHIELRVGRRAEDNDELSCNPKYRDGADWWLHAQGYPGSHVVIRSHDDSLPTVAPETLKDAAFLAAVNSKGPQKGKLPVSYTRCRHVTKPSGAKPGLVRLNADIGTVVVNIKEETALRAARLEATKVVNKPASSP